MSLVRDERTTRWSRAAAVTCVAIGVALLAAGAGGDPGKKLSPAPPEPTWTQTRDAPVILDTPANLQAAFTNEMNARERYLAYAKQAELEKYPAVARLFRACAVAESIHARRDVQAIAWTMTGQRARAVMERIMVGTTAENLRAALSNEQYEVDQWYPALIRQARADHMSMAVRSLTLALASERQHVELLSKALEHLEERPVAGAIFVCPYCGRTVESLEFGKCPGCYTSTARSLRPA